MAWLAFSKRVLILLKIALMLFPIAVKIKTAEAPISTSSNEYSTMSCPSSSFKNRLIKFISDLRDYRFTWVTHYSCYSSQISSRETWQQAPNCKALRLALGGAFVSTQLFKALD